ncbi:UNVERIFIED_CONTAM: hypothetical protein Sradi_5271100 [Sesamum radiatum]|uniref:Uncharacterized protein n=1 Tax=Sesamum radiatum TaxID=300843 RepID=A0AAW2LQX0_SESRA
MSGRKKAKVGESSSQSRSRSFRAATVLPPAPDSLGGNLQFHSRSARERYFAIRVRKIIPCKVLHQPTITDLNISTSFTLLVENIGWKCFFDCNVDSFTELVHEFYSTFEFTTPSDLTLSTPNVLKFRLLGRAFSLSLTDFNIALGFTTPDLAQHHEYLTSVCNYRDEFKPNELWRQYSVDPNVTTPVGLKPCI